MSSIRETAEKMVALDPWNALPEYVAGVAKIALTQAITRCAMHEKSDKGACGIDIANAIRE